MKKRVLIIDDETNLLIALSDPTLPLSALMLGVMFFWKRRVYMFDHLIFSMHSLSFQGLLVTAMLLLAKVWGGAGWLILLSGAFATCPAGGATSSVTMPAGPVYVVVDAAQDGEYILVVRAH